MTKKQEVLLVMAYGVIGIVLGATVTNHFMSMDYFDLAEFSYFISSWITIMTTFGAIILKAFVVLVSATLWFVGLLTSIDMLRENNGHPEELTIEEFTKQWTANVKAVKETLLDEEIKAFKESLKF